MTVLYCIYHTLAIGYAALWLWSLNILKRYPARSNRTCRSPSCHGTCYRFNTSTSSRDQNGTNSAEEQNESSDRLSLIVACRNEAERIGLLLNTLAQQSLPASEWEVIFVDDESTDETARVIGNWIEAHPQLSAQLIAGPQPGSKKAALAAGIAAARNPIILTTDADCWAGQGWLAEMAAPFARPSVDFAIGLVVYQSAGSFCQDLQQAESLGLVSLGAAAALQGKPYLANGANFAFRRSAFEAVGGYRHGSHLASGDDTFLVESFHEAGFRGTCIWQAQALVWTCSATSWRAYWQQNIRWLSKARASRSGRQRATQVLGLLVWGSWWPLALGLGLDAAGRVEVLLLLSATALRIFADFALTKPLLQLAGLQRPLSSWLLGQLVYAAWVPAVAARALTGSSYVWRGRRMH